MGTARRHLFAIGVVVLPVVMLAAGHAVAQTMPWPGDTPQQAAPAPWPGQAAPAPAPMTGAPRPVMAGPGMGAPGMGAPGMGGGGGGGAAQQCMAEFAKLRDEVQKQGMAAKAAGQRKAPREEMCKLITNYAASEAKWVSFTVAGVSNCGIPPQIANQLKEVHAHTEKTKAQICAAGPAGGGGGAMSISEALGTTRVATPDLYKGGNGTFDTLTGSAIKQ
jgi:hypothetical protein